jgi:hypothetical protein
MKKSNLLTLIQILMILTLGVTSVDVTTGGADDGSTNTTTSTYSQAQADEMKQKRDAACEGLDIKVELQTDEYMSEEREKYKNSFTESVDLLLDIYQNGDYMKILNMQLAFLIIIVLFLVLVIISSIIFFINICICCCNGKDNNRGCCISCNLVISLIGLVGFAACCVSIAIFVGGVKSGMNEVNCSLHNISNDLINGNTAVKNFMGFFPLTKILNQYITDFNNLITNHKQNLNDIVALDLLNGSQSALDSLDTFCPDCSTKTTSDGEGNQASPHSVGTALTTLKDGGKTEFTLLRDTCKIIDEGARAGADQVNSADTQSIIDSIKSVVDLVSGIIVTFDSSFGTIGSSYNTVDSQYNTAQIVFIVFCFTCLLVGILIFIGLCCAYNNKGCDKFCCCRIIIAVLGLFALIFMIFSFAVGVVTFATSTSCGLLQQFSKEEGINKFIDLFSLEGDMKNILTTCLLESGNGSLSEIFLGESTSNQGSSDMFTQVQELLDMFGSYTDLFDSLPADNMSVAFTAYKDAIEKFKSGELPDHDNVLVSLAALNDIVSCDSSIYSLTASSCPASSTCIDIKTTGSYTAPSCQTDAAQNTQATTLFNNLKTYITETETLVDELIGKTYSQTTSPSTPNKLYHDTVVKFDDAAAKLDLIKVDLQSTIDMINNNNIMEGTNCQILRAEFQSLESTMCFKFVPNLYKFMLAAFIASVFFFSFVWHFCCGTFCLERSGEHGEDAEVADNYDNTQFNPKGGNNYYN